MRDVEARPDSAEAGIAHRVQGITHHFAAEFVEAARDLELALALFGPGRDGSLPAGFRRRVDDLSGVRFVGSRHGPPSRFFLERMRTRTAELVLFELIAARYERRSMLITPNQPFGEWRRIFPDQAMTLAAIDRLILHAKILEMNVESYRRKRSSSTS